MSSFPYANIMSRLVNVPLLAHPRKAAVVYDALCGRFGGSQFDALPQVDAERIDALQAARVPQASRFEGAWPQAQDGRGIEPFRLTSQGVGIVTVTGSLINRGAWVGSYSGETSYEGIKHQLSRAGRDNRVKAVILDMESPGGEAVGTFEAAAAVRALAAIKPVYAVCNGMMCSAAYAIASGATRIINGPTGLAGSIGVVMLHLDHSKMLEQKGVKPTLIFAGAHKVDANPLEPLSEAVEADLQAEVQKFYTLFVETVVAGRGKRTPAKAVRETEARTFIGQDAVDARIADAVGTFEEVLEDVSRVVSRASSRSQTRSASAMTNRNLASQEDLNTPGAEAIASAAAAAAAQGKDQGIAEANARIAAIVGNPDIKGDRVKAALDMAAKSPSMSAADICAFVVAHVPEAATPAAAPAAAADPVRTIQQRAAETGAEQVSGAPDATKGTRQESLEMSDSDVKAGWGSIITKQNERTRRENPGRALAK